ncbi:hypothetical protein DOTSEDRAFT_165938 [Dothistroma septosporum NZE10]|uniref:Xylanolytic transcriptional activator regulatory domain-containing protein n=1 Tax=Dothistroma septosporum (strain NZE10 / CBS 128990) TaxID=675120 RepID=N1PW20_DOTSN|nr:hypothetical protein DOTSEDRAFT_165938 [Dothistroma septosporum NZE10]
MNPATTFLQRNNPNSTSGETRIGPNEDIGIWVDKREWDALLRQKNEASEEASSAAQLNNYKPHPTVLAPLIDIYFRKIHPIFPILNEEKIRNGHARVTTPEPLAHAICLVAAKDPEATPHLRLSESAVPLAPREFCSRLHASVMAAIRVPSRYEKITLIRILALASLHAEGQDGAEEAAMCANQAMHYTQTLGWHLGQQTDVASGDDLTTKRLFWCLWSLDRINSCIYGRPIMMSDIDIAIETFEPGESGYPAFEVWLYITRLMNKIIHFYRPGNPPSVTGWEEEHYPSFEEAVDEGQAWDQPQSVLATLHLFYLSVAILSHRSRGVKYMPRSGPSYVRQSLASIELHRLMNSHLFTLLHPLPILPYAISLALSVSYQHLRQAQLSHQQEDAREDFRTCCKILQTLRRTWSSADVIATIAKKVLDEVNRISDLSSFRVSRIPDRIRDSPGICTASLSRPHTLIDQHDDHDTAAEGSTHADVATIPEANGVSTQYNPVLFEGMDDLFGTYMDPNYPVNLDDFSFVDDLSPLDWNAVPTQSMTTGPSH